MEQIELYFFFQGSITAIIMIVISNSNNLPFKKTMGLGQLAATVLRIPGRSRGDVLDSRRSD